MDKKRLLTCRLVEAADAAGMLALVLENWEDQQQLKKEAKEFSDKCLKLWKRLSEQK